MRPFTPSSTIRKPPVPSRPFRPEGSRLPSSFWVGKVEPTGAKAPAARAWALVSSKNRGARIRTFDLTDPNGAIAGTFSDC